MLLQPFENFIPILDEYQKRMFFGTMALSLGPCSAKQVADSFGVNIKTVYAGLKEIKQKYQPQKGKVRRSGGGRKKKIEMNPEWVKILNRVITPYKAGLPQDDTVYWLNITVPEITQLMRDEGCNVTNYIVRQLLKSLGFKKRSFVKNLPMKEVENRDEQFKIIRDVLVRCFAIGLPVLSIDTKKKELIGDFKRDGQVESVGTPLALDHDFATFSKGLIVPHGIYDVARNVGYLTIGTSHDTSEFVCENIERVWNKYLYKYYPGAETIVLLCDGGGSNASSHHIVKQDLMDLAKRLNMNIMVMHYPPYCSKWNPIEHRFFSQVSLKWKGITLTSIGLAAQRASMATTTTGLKTYVEIVEKNYEIKRKIRKDYAYNLKTRVFFRDDLPKWNYLIKP